MTGGPRYRVTSGLVRAGLALAAVAGLLMALAPTGDIASGPARDAPRTTATIDLEPAVGALGVAGAVLLAAAAAAPWLWAHLAGVALATIVSATAGLIVLTGARPTTSSPTSTSRSSAEGSSSPWPSGSGSRRSW